LTPVAAMLINDRLKREGAEGSTVHNSMLLVLVSERTAGGG